MGLDLYDFVLDLERRFDVSLSDETAQRMATVGDLQEWLSIASPRWDHERSQEELYRLISDHLGVPVGDIRPHSRFIEDLGIE